MDHHHHPETTGIAITAGGGMLWITETGIVIVTGETIEETTGEMIEETIGETETEIITEDREALGYGWIIELCQKF